MARFVTVTPNPAIDVTYAVERQILGETLRVRDVLRLPGGKGVNVARVLHALGRDVVALQPLGGASGRWMQAALTDLGLSAVACDVVGETRTTVTLVDGSGHPTLLAEPGTALAPEEWTRLGAALSGVARAGDWVVIAGSFPPESTPEHLALLIRAAHERGASVAVDTSGAMLRAAVDAGADLVKANEREILEATDATDALVGLTELARGGAAVMMSRGADGAVLRLADGTLHEQAAVPDVDGNPTGAGDAATAGLIAALGEDHDAATALTWAALCGAAAVLRAAAGEIAVDAIPVLAHRLSASDTALDLLHTERSTQ